MESFLFLLAIMLVGIIAKNYSLSLAVVVVLIIKLLPNSSFLFDNLRSKGINWGVFIITISILVPIANGTIGFDELAGAFKSYIGFVAIFSGILVSLLSSKGLFLQTTKPEITVALTIGTILGIVFFKGMAAGPIIAGGITYFIVNILSTIYKSFF